MNKYSGIHFYINIINFNKIIIDEEMNTNSVTHSIHALDTFFTSIEKYGKSISNNLVVEKITGSRLHLYVVDEIEIAYEVAKKVSFYAQKLASYLNTEIPKYKKLKDFHINVGASYGRFYDFEFVAKEGYSESTTIGYAANFAAKLQALSGYGMFSISENIYEVLSLEEQRKYEIIKEESIKKYDQDKYYTISLYNLDSSVNENDLLKAKDYAYSDNLGDIEFSGVRKLLNFEDLSKTKCKKLDGIPVFADVRGFTSQFEEDDSNLEDMARKTQEVLESMYRISTSCGGVHIQFQGDRELSLYHNVPGQTINGLFQVEKKCFKSAVLASMRIIDEVKKYNVHIGVGEDFGRLFATKIGARGEKDNIILGETVINADLMEDKNAGENQVVITNEVYEGLKGEDEYLSSQFKKSGNYYVATVGYKEYLRALSYRQQEINNSQKKYNGAWRV